MKVITMTKSYRKPFAICKHQPELEDLTTPAQIRQFIEAEKTTIEKRVSALGHHLRLATQTDIESISDLQSKCFPKGTLLEDSYVLYRITRFGYAPVVEAADGRIVACNLSEGYDDPCRTLWGIRNTVDAPVSGANLGVEMVMYSSLMGMERGRRVRQGFISPYNFAALANALNHTGFIINAFHLKIPGHQGPRFVAAMPLTPAGLLNNRIDSEKMRAFIETHRAGTDYAIAAASDVEGLVHMYARTPFRIVAFLKAEHAFLAVPENELGMESVGTWQ
jgi:hypothetical protein